MRQDIAGSAYGYFGSMVDSYDSLIRRAVPRYDEMTARLLEYLPRNADRVLELGCGTGNLSLQLARSFPNAALTLVDASPEMTTVTRSRIEQANLELQRDPVYVIDRFESLE